MCSDLIDFRGKVSRETDAWLDTQSQITGEDRQTIVRNILHKLALEHIEATSIAHQRYLSKGLVGAVEGVKGSGGGK